MQAGIIAAGEGSRLKQQGWKIPKPLVEIHGEPMIRRLVSILDRASFHSINICINEKMPEVYEYIESIKNDFRSHINVYSVFTPSSFHTFASLIENMDKEDDIVITTVDTVFNEQNFRSYIEYVRNNLLTKGAIFGVTRFIDDEKPLYVDVDGKMRIRGFYDNEMNDGYISAGVYALGRQTLHYVKSAEEKKISRMRNFQRFLISEGVTVHAFDLGKVVDVDHPSDISKANRLVDENPTGQTL